MLCTWRQESAQSSLPIGARLSQRTLLIIAPRAQHRSKTGSQGTLPDRNLFAFLASSLGMRFNGEVLKRYASLEDHVPIKLGTH